MIKQDYLVRMIQEIISLIANAILNKKKLRKQEWVEYDCLTRQILGFPAEQLIDMDMRELIERYKGDPDEMGKIELAAMSMLKLSEDMFSDHVLQKSKLRQDGLWLLKYVQEEGNTFSIQRTSLIKLLEINGGIKKTVCRSGANVCIKLAVSASVNLEKLYLCTPVTK